MARGRPPEGPKLAEKVEASAEAKRRLRVILETLAGEKAVAEACAELGIEEARFHQLRNRALAAAAAGLEPGTPGRPGKAPPTETEAKRAELEAKIADLEVDLQASRIREEIAIAMPHLLKPRREDQKKTTPIIGNATSSFPDGIARRR